ncbi:hypothetical protein ZOSMA_270G00050 [Zostera marina]|uniref:FAR1 domain-containing protein n=1 Tax=Zostera marina TaxID=29655 RepID=A0A0K9PDU9_ZOSMR|nr:hypothetical protein ZOSMA_270G00050 [Zostera marina]
MDSSTQGNIDLDLQQSITSNDHPSTDMSFNTLEDAENFYYRYAGHTGFSVCKSTTSSNTDGITRRTLVCSKNRKSNAIIPSSTTSSKKKRNIRNPGTGYKAKITFFVKDDIWFVSICITSYNHLLSTPSKRRFLPTNRKITPHTKNIIHELEASNVAPSQ